MSGIQSSILGRGNPFRNAGSANDRSACAGALRILRTKSITTHEHEMEKERRDG